MNPRIPATANLYAHCVASLGAERIALAMTRWCRRRVQETITKDRTDCALARRRPGTTASRGRNMQTVILCGGKGTRLREETEFRPKAMVTIGDKPIVWHIMKG